MALPDPISIQTASTVEDIFEAFENLIRPADAQEFRTTSLDDVKKFAQSIEREQEEQGCQLSLRRLEPLFESLEGLHHAVETLCHCTTDLGFLWAPIQLVLQIVEKHKACFARFVEQWHEIGLNIPRLAATQGCVEKHACYDSIVVETCKDILEFHSATYRLVRRTAWDRLFSASWKSFAPHSKNIVQRLARNSALIGKAATASTAADARASRQSLLDELAEKISAQRESQLGKVLTWLGVGEQLRRQDALFERLASARQAGTCQWLLRHPKLISWLDEDSNDKILWLKGKPGSGKTTLVTYLVEEAEIPSGAIMLYCLCSHSFVKADAQPASLAYRLLIAQVIRHRNDLLPFLHEQVIAKSNTMTFRTIKLMLRDLLQSIEFVYVIVDGVDECERIHQSELTQELTALTGARSAETIGSLRLLICSRDTREIARKLRRKPFIFLTQESEHVLQDIELFTTRRMNEIKELDKFDIEILEDIGKQIVQKANGMFLWVRLVLSELEMQESEHYLRQALRELPSDINSVYSIILKRIQSSRNELQRTQARHIFGLLVFAYRPLKHWELCDALVLHECDLELNHSTRFDKGILEICKPLVEERNDDTYALVHFSVREYLTQKISGPYLEASKVHLAIACCCIRYLLSCRTFTCPKLEAAVSGDIVRGLHNLYPYVHEFWVTHLKHSLIEASSEISGQSIKNNLDSLLGELMQTMFPNLSTTQHEDVHSDPPAEGAEVAASNDEIPPGNVYGDAVVRDGGSALMGNTYNSVNIMGGIHLHCKADCTETAKASSSSMQSYEHLIVKACGHPDYAAPLPLPAQLREYIEFRDLRRNKSANAGTSKDDPSNHDPSHLSVAYATYQCEFEILIEGALERDLSQMRITRHQLEDFCARHRKFAFRCRITGCPSASSGFGDAKEREKHENLHKKQFACTFDDCGDIFYSRRQLQRHIDMYHTHIEDVRIPKFPTLKTKVAGHFEANELEYFIDRTKLARASARGDIDLVKASLVTEPETINTPDPGGLTPLHIAAIQGHSQIVEILLRDAANVNTEDVAGNTPLISASRNGHFAVVKLLHAHGASLRAKNTDGFSAYDIVPEGGFHYAAIRQLLDFHNRTAHMVKLYKHS